MAFDVDGARKAGYSDDEIASYLAQQSPQNKAVAAAAQAGGYAPDEIIQHLTGPKANTIPPAKPGNENAPDDPGFWGSMMVAGGKSVDHLTNGLAQAWLGATGATDSTKAALKGTDQEAGRLYAPVAAAHPVATGIGEALPSMAVPVGGAASVLGRMGKAAIQGAVIPALSYGSVGDRATAAAAGGAGAAVGSVVVPAVAAGAGRVIQNAGDWIGGQISPAVAQLAQRATQLGIPVTRAQLSDSNFIKTLASQVEKFPLSGGTQSRAAQQGAFNQAVSRTIGEDTPVVNQDVYNSAKQRIGGEFQRLSSQNNLNVTPALLQDVNGVVNDATRYGTGDTARVVRNLALDLDSHVDPTTGTIPGEAYQAFDSNLSRLMKSNDPTSIHIGALRDAVRGAMDQSISPADQAAWTTARGQYKNLKAIRDIVGKAGVDGDISPALLMGRLQASDAGKETMAMGTRGDLGDIARIGRQFITDRVPNSGTANRVLANSVMTGVGGGTAALAGLPAAAAAAGTTVATGRVLNRVLNTAASGQAALAANSARGTAAAPATLAQLLNQNPRAAVAGKVAGMTLADMNNRGNQ